MNHDLQDSRESDMNWFRYHTEALDNRKVQSLPGELFKSWINLLCLSRLHGGSLPPVPDIAFRLRVSETEVESVVRQLIDRRLLEIGQGCIYPHDWESHQYASDDSTGRVRKFRHKKKLDEIKHEEKCETFPKRFRNVIEQNRTEQNRTEAAVVENGIGEFTEFPKSALAITAKYQSADYVIVGRIIQSAVQAHLSVDHPKIHLTDEILCDAIRAAVSENPKQSSVALFLKTVPPVISNWGKNGRPNGNGSSVTFKSKPSDREPRV